MTETSPEEAPKGALSKVLSALRSPAVKVLFLVIALAFAVWAVISQWDNIRDALTRLDGGILAITTVLAIIYVFVTMLSWREILVDLGTDISVRDASKLFFISQLGKYVPGGVWNYLAVVEMGAQREIPRRRSLSAMVVSVLVSIVSAGLLAVPGLAFTGHVPLSQSAWLFALLPVVIVFLIPPVLNRVIAFALRLARRPPLEHPLSGAGILKSTLYALLGWLISGTVVWLIAVQLGMPASVPSFLLAAGGYSLSWAIGFIVFFMPAGLGVREVVLAAMLAGFLGPGELIVVVLLARVLSTIADVVLGVGSFALRDRPARDETPNETD